MKTREKDLIITSGSAAIIVGTCPSTGKEYVAIRSAYDGTLHRYLNNVPRTREFLRKALNRLEREARRDPSRVKGAQ